MSSLANFYRLAAGICAALKYRSKLSRFGVCSIIFCVKGQQLRDIYARAREKLDRWFRLATIHSYPAAPLSVSRMKISRRRVVRLIRLNDRSERDMTWLFLSCCAFPQRVKAKWISATKSGFSERKWSPLRGNKTVVENQNSFTHRLHPKSEWK